MFRTGRRMALLLLFGGLPLSRQASAQGVDYVKEHYTKHEFRIPMRDGKRLFTAVYAPKDSSEQRPILLLRTPYSVKPYGVDQYRPDLGPSPLFAKEGYIFAYQDVRGRWMSEGEFVNMRPHLDNKTGPNEIDESTDTWDTIDWLVRHIPANNGKVGTWGISYPGFYAAAGMIDAHPAHKAASPQAPINDWFVGDDWHRNAARCTWSTRSISWPTSDARAPSQPRSSNSSSIMELPTPTSSFSAWDPCPRRTKSTSRGRSPSGTKSCGTASTTISGRPAICDPHLRKIRPAVMTVGGWFDAENLFGALETYRRVEESSPGISNTLVMGPWRHGEWGRGDGQSLGEASFHAKTGVFYRENIEFPFFQFHLKGKGELKQPEAWMFETGTNQWRRYDAWPPRKAAPGRSTCAAMAGCPLQLQPPRIPKTPLMSTSATPPDLFPTSTRSALPWRRSSWWETSVSPLGGPTCSSTKPTCCRRT